MAANINLSFDEMWEKIIACDHKYDGLFFTAVKTTKIYCRPSCHSRKPKKVNVEFFNDIKTVENAGFRACKRCQPEADHSPQLKWFEMSLHSCPSNFYKVFRRLKNSSPTEFRTLIREE